jgi:hypothetical protein
MVLLVMFLIEERQSDELPQKNVDSLQEWRHQPLGRQKCIDECLLGT